MSTTLKDQLEKAKIEAMKTKRGLSGDELERANIRLSAIRSAITAVAKVETSFKERRDLTDEEVIAVLRKEAAQREESARVYTDAGESFRAAVEKAEAAVLDVFLPGLLDDAATRELVASIIEEQGLAGAQGIGRVMGQLKTRSDVDKGLASKIAKELL